MRLWQAQEKENVRHAGGISVEQYGAVVIDDASHICKQSMLHWQTHAPTGRSGKPDRFFAYQELNKHLLMLASVARHLDCHLAMTWHERPPGTNSEGAFAPGGPDVPSRNQTEVLPSWCDINVRAMVDPTYPDPWFPGIYYVNPSDPEWVTGDRTGVCSKKTPGNLREILRASRSNYRLDRLPSLDWQDDVADAVAEGVVEGLDVKSHVLAVAGRYKDQYNPLHLRWACQDGVARGTLQRSRACGLFDFSAEEPAKTNGAGNFLPPPPPIQ